MNIVKITKTPLNLNVLTGEVTSESCGAISVFLGTTRDNFNGKKVVQ